MNFHTQEDARMNWCPFGRANMGKDMAASNRDHSGYGADNSKCLASRCMSWRGKKQWRPRSDYPWEDGKAESSGPNVQERIVGYCGLAGTP